MTHSQNSWTLGIDNSDSDQFKITSYFIDSDDDEFDTALAMFGANVKIQKTEEAPSKDSNARTTDFKPLLAPKVETEDETKLKKLTERMMYDLMLLGKL